MEDSVSTDWGWVGRGWFLNIRVHPIYGVLYIYYYDISSTSHHQARDLGGWGPLPQAIILSRGDSPAQGSYTMSGDIHGSVQSRATISSPMDCSTPGLPVHHQLLELGQTHFDRVGDTFQPSQPLSSPSPPALNLSQHQGLFK